MEFDRLEECAAYEEALAVGEEGSLNVNIWLRSFTLLRMLLVATVRALRHILRVFGLLLPSASRAAGPAAAQTTPPAGHQARQHAEHHIDGDDDTPESRRCHHRQDEPTEKGENQHEQDGTNELADTDLPPPGDPVREPQACAHGDGIGEAREGDARKHTMRRNKPFCPDQSINYDGSQHEDVGEGGCEQHCPRNGAAVLQLPCGKFGDFVSDNQLEFCNSSEPSREFSFDELTVRLDLTSCHVHPEPSELLQQHLPVFHVPLAELPQDETGDQVHPEEEETEVRAKPPR
mmetsp:Transcript_7275/g.21984  ORF Transcript_7275/g.21984 Transcript_7275/m.21984 type:complete len:290 (+) Transcript_7275:273-1142(+)